MKYKVTCFIIILFTIAVGLFVRIRRSLFPEWINFWLGDALYAFMMYYIVGAIFSGWASKSRTALALGTCYSIELLQLYQAPWITSVRATLPGKLIFGSGFLWSDMAAYLVGVAAALCVDLLWLSPRQTAI